MSAIDQIDRELSLLNQAIATLAQEFHSTYGEYLTALGQAVRQQLISAGYHICTRGYPQKFLALSLTQQQQLQQELRQLSQQAQSSLMEQLQPVQPVDFSQVKSQQDKQRSLVTQFSEMSGGMSAELRKQNLEALIDRIERARAEALELEKAEAEAGLESSLEPNLDSDLEPDLESDLESELESDLESELELSLEADGDQELDAEPDYQAANQELFAAIFRNSAPEETAPLPTFDASRPLIPKDLLYWQDQLEEKISHEIQSLSHSTNRALQQAGILPQRLPEPLLDVAAKANATADANIPNVLNILLETPNSQETTHVMALRLRLSELEFHDPMVMAGRSRIRTLLNRLNKLNQEYQKKQKQKAIVQAEAAWRSSWYES